MSGAAAGEVARIIAHGLAEVTEALAAVHGPGPIGLVLVQQAQMCAVRADRQTALRLAAEMVAAARAIAVGAGEGRQ